MDHRKQDHNTSSFKVILFLIASTSAFTTLPFMVSLGGGGVSETSSKFLSADQTGGFSGLTDIATVPSCGYGTSIQDSA